MIRVTTMCHDIVFDPLPRDDEMWMKQKWMGMLGACLLLSACQTMPRSPGAVTSGPEASLQSSVQPGAGATAERAPELKVSSSPRAVDLRLFIADVKPHVGWTAVALKPRGILYVRTDPVITRADLMGIQSATDQAGGGILILALNDGGFRKVQAATSAHPGLRLALVVGQTMLAAPGYAAPIHEQQLAFAVGTPRNAQIAARAVAGVDPQAAEGF